VGLVSGGLVPVDGGLVITAGGGLFPGVTDGGGLVPVVTLPDVATIPPFLVGRTTVGLLATLTVVFAGGGFVFGGGGLDLYSSISSVDSDEDISSSLSFGGRDILEIEK
jgi:hypothetical protein